MSTDKKIIDIEAPVFPESVTDATLIEWYVKEGDVVELDQKLVDLETDKVVLEVVATAPGRISRILESKDAVVREKAVLGKLSVEDVSKPSMPEEKVEAVPAKEEEQPRGLARLFRGPSARRTAKEHNEKQVTKPAAESQRVQTGSTSTTQTELAKTPTNAIARVPMTRLRAKVAERLLAAQHEAAILTTFNEVNLESIIRLRNRYKAQFEEQHGVRLGFMSFFTKAAVEALKQFPKVNAAIDGEDILYHHYYDIGIAVSTERGLVVPVVRNADQLSLSSIEKAINQYGQSARNGTISINELSGGTFTITNGGIFGSLLSTPILNPPQSGILGMHKIEERPIVENGQIVVKPMMYLALSYDHRIIDGKESVQFLSTIKNLLEDPTRLLLDI